MVQRQKLAKNVAWSCFGSMAKSRRNIHQPNIRWPAICRATSIQIPPDGLEDIQHRSSPSQCNAGLVNLGGQIWSA